MNHDLELVTAVRQAIIKARPGGIVIHVLKRSIGCCPTLMKILAVPEHICVRPAFERINQQLEKMAARWKAADHLKMKPG